MMSQEKLTREDSRVLARDVGCSGWEFNWDQGATALDAGRGRQESLPCLTLEKPTERYAQDHPLAGAFATGDPVCFSIKGEVWDSVNAPHRAEPTISSPKISSPIRVEVKAHGMHFFDAL